MQAFRQFLAPGGLNLPSNPIYIARLTGLPRGQRNDTSRHKGEDVSPSIYNLRLAIFSTWLTFGMMESAAPITDLAARLGHIDIKITQAYTEKLSSADNPNSSKITRRYGIRRKGATR